MITLIEDEYAFEKTDDLNWTLYKSVVNKKTEKRYWKAVSYHARPEDVARAVAANVTGMVGMTMRQYMDEFRSVSLRVAQILRDGT